MRYTRPHRMHMILAIICSSITKIFDILPEALIGVAIDVVVNKQESFIARFGFSDLSTQLYLLGGLTFFVWSMESLFEYFSDVLWRNLAQTIQHELRLDTYGHMQNLDMNYFENKTTGNLLAMLNDDINQLDQFFDTGLADLIYLVVGTFGVAVIFFSLAPRVAIFSLLPVPAILLITGWFHKKLVPLYIDVRNKAGRLAARITNNIMGMVTIKSYTTEVFELERLAKESNAYRHSYKNIIPARSAFIPVVRMAIVFGFIVAIILGGWQVAQGQLAVGSYSVLVFMTQRLLWPFTELAKMTDRFTRSMASGKRVFTILDTQIGIVSGKQPLPRDRVKGEIKFNDVSFMYPGGMEVFDRLSFSIKASQTVAFVGPTGGGKSTLIKLILRFYDATKGVIFIDGVDIKDFRLKDLRRAIGLVSQDVFLFHGSVRENIAYGRPDVSMEDIRRAAEIAESHDFIMNLPNGYDTQVGERGQKLSGGQKQRISIARAVLDNPPIFIFDEATSAVDNETEVAIQHSLEKMSEDRTTIIIAHRLSTVRNADNIFVLDHGVIVESGTHEELVTKEGVYTDLWRVQTGEHV